ncbi:MAG: hypothetical protein ACRERU_01230 [Methylococcales bacterium]
MVSREAELLLPDGPITVATTGGDTLTVKKVMDEAAQEVRWYCHSPQREAKERGIAERFCQRFEQGLAEGLTRPRAERCPDKILRAHRQIETTQLRGRAALHRHDRDQ